MKPLSRRDFLKVGGLTFLGTAGATTVLTHGQQDHVHQDEDSGQMAHRMQQGGHGDLPGTVGEVDHEKNGFNPTEEVYSKLLQVWGNDNLEKTLTWKLTLKVGRISKH